MCLFKNEREDNVDEYVRSIRPRAVLVIETEGGRLYANIEEDAINAGLGRILNPLKTVLKNGTAEKYCELPEAIKFEEKSMTAKRGDVIVTDGKKLSIALDQFDCTGCIVGGFTFTSNDRVIEVLGEGDMEAKLFLEWSE